MAQLSRLVTMAQSGNITPSNPFGWESWLLSAIRTGIPNIVDIVPAPGVPTIRQTAELYLMGVYIDRALGATDGTGPPVGYTTDGTPLQTSLVGTDSYDAVLRDAPFLMAQIQNICAVAGIGGLPPSIAYVSLPTIAGYFGSPYAHLSAFRAAGIRNLGLDVGFFVDPARLNGWHWYDAVAPRGGTGATPRLCGESCEPLDARLLGNLQIGTALVLDWTRYLSASTTPGYAWTSDANLHPVIFPVAPGSLAAATRQAIYDSPPAQTNLVIGLEVDGLTL